MAVTDLYVAQYLLSATLEQQAPLRWFSNEAGAYHADAHGVELELFYTHSMGWTGLCLSFRSSKGTARLAQAAASG